MPPSGLDRWRRAAGEAEARGAAAAAAAAAAADDVGADAGVAANADGNVRPPPPLLRPLLPRRLLLTQALMWIP